MAVANIISASGLPTSKIAVTSSCGIEEPVTPRYNQYFMSKNDFKINCRLKRSPAMILSNEERAAVTPANPAYLIFAKHFEFPAVSPIAPPSVAAEMSRVKDVRLPI
jgi:hypothetical protein